MIAELGQYDIEFTGIEAAIQNWVREALELRHGAGEDPEGPLGNIDYSRGGNAISALLVRVRSRSDRVDMLLANVTQAKARTRRAQQAAEFEASVAYDTATKTNAANRRVEFSTARERHADAALDSLEQKRVAHHAERTVSIATEAYEVINQIHWQLESIRKDLRAAIHNIQFESSLER
jgi:aromatic ring-cleaving dioxygenase